MPEYFPQIDPIEYRGPENEEDLAFKYYEPDKKLNGTRMEDHLRFSVAFWHSFCERGTDPFGDPTTKFPWDEIDDPMDQALTRVDAAFEFMEKLGVPYFCFHDRDIAPRGDDLTETNANLDRVVDHVADRMDDTGIGLLWGTAQLFAEPKYAHGAATSPNAEVFAHAAAQVKKVIDITNRLEGENVVLWGGREGYKTLLNTDVERERDNMARFLEMTANYASDEGFDGQLLLEPKPREPMKHQYDYDAATVLAFLREYGLEDRYALNIEANHATLAGHTFQHELRYARINNALGSVDANQGDKLVGWDTDEFPTNVYATSLAMYEILASGGIAPGGLNFDAKARRESTDIVDRVNGHIAGMDAFARGLEVANALHRDNAFSSVIDERYASYDSGLGKRIEEGDIDLEVLADEAKDIDGITPDSGRQERLESVLNRYILDT